MPDWVVELLRMVAPVLIGAFTTEIFEAWQKFWGKLHAAAPWVKRLAVTLIGFALTKLAASGVALTGTDPATLGVGDVEAVLTAGFAFLFHMADRAKQKP